MKNTITINGKEFFALTNLEKTQNAIFDLRVILSNLKDVNFKEVNNIHLKALIDTDIQNAIFNLMALQNELTK